MPENCQSVGLSELFFPEAVTSRLIQNPYLENEIASLGVKGFWVPILEQHDLERYRQYVADVDMPESQKDELIGIVANIMAHFVDAAFGETPEQIILEQRENSAFVSASDCGKLPRIPEKETIDDRSKSTGQQSDSMEGPIS
mgnify:CR=1 FL=1